MFLEVLGQKEVRGAIVCSSLHRGWDGASETRGELLLKAGAPHVFHKGPESMSVKVCVSSHLL